MNVGYRAFVPQHPASHRTNRNAKPLRMRDKSEANERVSKRRECVAVGAVLSEPVSGPFSLLTGKLTGKISKNSDFCQNQRILL